MSRINYRIFLASIVSFVFFFSFFHSSQAGFFDWFKKFRKNDSQSATEVVSRVQQDAFYTVSISKSGSGAVTSDDGKINCGKQCKMSFSANSKIVLKAEAGNNYKFERWNGCDKVLDGKCQTTLNKSKMIVAKFSSKKASSSSSSQKSSSKSSFSKSSSASSKPSNYKSFASSQQTQNYKTLTIKNVFYNNGKGIVKVGDKTCDVSRCVFEYSLNKSLELQSEAEADSVLSDWGYDCDYVFAPNNICSLIMNDDKTVIVHFEPYISTSFSSKSSSSNSSAGLSFNSSSSLSTDNQYYLKIISPNGGEGFKKGSTQFIKFTTNKFDRFITLKLYKNNNYLRDIGYYDIAYSNSSKNSENSYSWNVPDFLIDGEDYKIYATITNSKELYGYEISDWSDNVFALKMGGEEVLMVSSSASSKSSSSSSSENFITSSRTSIPWMIEVLVLDDIDQNSKVIEPLKEAIGFVESFSKFDITYSLAFSSLPHTYTKYDCGEGLQTCVVVNYWDIDGVIMDSLSVADSYIIFWNTNNQPPLQAGSTWGVDSWGILKGGIKRPYATIPVDMWWYNNNPFEGFQRRSAQIISHELINIINAKLETAPYYCASLSSTWADIAYINESERLKKLTDDCYNKY